MKRIAREVVILAMMPASAFCDASPIRAAAADLYVYDGPSDCSVNVAPQLSDFINSKPAGSVITFTPGGCYRIDTRVYVDGKTNLTIDGNSLSGTRFERRVADVVVFTGPSARSEALWWFQGGSNLTVRNLTTQGNHTSCGVTGVYDFKRESQHGYRIAGVRGMTLNNVRVTNIWGDFLYLRESASDVNVLNSTFICNGRQGAGIVDAERVLFRGNIFDDMRRTIFDFEANSVDDVVSDIRIEGNTIGRARFHFVQWGGLSAENVAVVNNTLIGRPLIVTFDTRETNRRKNWVVEGNTSDTPSGQPAVNQKNLDGLTVRNNRAPVARGVDPVVCTNCTNVIEAGNDWGR